MQTVCYSVLHSPKSPDENKTMATRDGFMVFRAWTGVVLMKREAFQNYVYHFHLSLSNAVVEGGLGCKVYRNAGVSCLTTGLCGASKDLRSTASCKYWMVGLMQGKSYRVSVNFSLSALNESSVSGSGQFRSCHRCCLWMPLVPETIEAVSWWTSWVCWCHSVSLDSSWVCAGSPAVVTAFVGPLFSRSMTAARLYFCCSGRNCWKLRYG